MGTKVKRRHRKKEEERPQAPALKLPKLSRLQVLVGILVIFSLSAFAMFKLNSKEVTTEVSPEELEIKKQMLEQFMQRQQAPPGGAETGTPGPPPAP